jgi:acyl carrier protein
MQAGVMTIPSRHLSPAFELEIKHLIVDSLMLTDQRPEDIDSTAPLFIEGLGLDSIDALELAMAIGKRYGVKFSSDDAVNRQTFANVRSLAAYVAKMATAPALENAR